MSEANTRIVLASRPRAGSPKNNFRIERLPLPQAADGQVLLKNSLPFARPIHARADE